MNIEIDDTLLIDGIVEKVVERLKPLINHGNKKLHVGDDIFTVESLAKYLQVSKQWVYERVHLKEIPFIKMGKFPRFKKNDIDNWLDSMKTPAMQPMVTSLKAIK